MGLINFVEINIEYSEMISQAKKLDDAADCCSIAASKISAQTAEMLNNWKGEAAEAMFLKLVEMLKETNSIQSELRSAASRLRNKAEALKSVDDSAASGFRR